MGALVVHRFMAVCVCILCLFVVFVCTTTSRENPRRSDRGVAAAAAPGTYFYHTSTRPQFSFVDVLARLHLASQQFTRHGDDLHVTMEIPLKVGVLLSLL